MKISNNGLKLIKDFEGCILHAYRCPAGVWTIGYGHTEGVKPGQTISAAKADEYLRSDVEKYEKHVESFRKKYNWNQNQFDAMVSFAFNIGSINQLTANGTRTIAQISSKITAYNKAGGSVLNGLVRRREAEKKLFDTPVKSTPVKKPAKEPVKKEVKKKLKKGAKIKIKAGAVDVNTKGKYAPYVYKNVYTVHSVGVTYVVFGNGKVATGKTKKSNCIVK